MVSSKVAAGKSFNFVLMICIGYIFGIVSKILIWQSSGELSLLIWVYGWNFIVTSFDALLVIHYSRPVPPVVLARQDSAGTGLGRMRDLFRLPGPSDRYQQAAGALHLAVSELSMARATPATNRMPDRNRIPHHQEG
jgi:hypothetical protein